MCILNFSHAENDRVTPFCKVFMERPSYNTMQTVGLDKLGVKSLLPFDCQVIARPALHSVIMT